MPERVWSGTPASPGIALGTAWRLPEGAEPLAGGRSAGREDECEAAVTALSVAAEELRSLARGLAPAEAAIVETGALMGEDPALIEAVRDATLTEGLGAAEAIMRATRRHAQLIAALGDEHLAARADDVHSLGRRAARLTTGRRSATPADHDVVAIARDLGPGDVAELASSLAGIVLEAGGPTAHAAIVARSLGIPMVTGLDDRAREISDDVALVLDGSSGMVVLEPSAERRRRAAAEMRARRLAAQRAHAVRDEPAVTPDGARVVVLANVATRAELEAALHAGAEGIGLLRTELAFLEARDWPTEQEHTRALAPILDGLDNRPAVVRVLDFGADKSPPFLHGVPERGLELLLAHQDAFISQLRAILLAARLRNVRILLPMVQSPEQISQSRELLESVGGRLGIDHVPMVGSMIETPEAAHDAAAIAAASDFLSIGTNDLTASTLGADRFAANSARAHHPRVLRAIARTVAAAQEAGISLEVCGEAASDPIMLPLLVGLGIDEVSVGAARVGAVRDWVRKLSAGEAAGLARSALTMDSAEEVAWAVRPLTADQALVR